MGLVVLPIVVATLVGAVALRPRGEGPDLSDVLGAQSEIVHGTVTSADVTLCSGTPPEAKSFCANYDVRLRTGVETGNTVSLENPVGPGSPELHVGDRIQLGTTDPSAGPVQYFFVDFDRDTPILVLGVLFALAVVALGRWSGVRALAALAASLLVLIWFVLPSILHGHSPIAVALVGAALIMVVVLYVTGGFNVRTTTAVLGTFASLALIAVLAWLFVAACNFTGLATEEAGFLQAVASEINLRGLLLGGIIIGSLGVLDDMTVTQVAAVWELRAANPAFTAVELYRAAERIGRNHIASTVNTLMLAYAGASLPLLILFTQSNRSLASLLTGEVIAIEVVRTLVGSIGLIASVPITTALASFVVTRPADESPGRRRSPPRRPVATAWDDDV